MIWETHGVVWWLSYKCLLHMLNTHLCSMARANKVLYALKVLGYRLFNENFCSSLCSETGHSQLLDSASEPSSLSPLSISPLAPPLHFSADGSPVPQISYAALYSFLFASVIRDAIPSCLKQHECIILQPGVPKSQVSFLGLQASVVELVPSGCSRGGSVFLSFCQLLGGVFALWLFTFSPSASLLGCLCLALF